MEIFKKAVRIVIAIAVISAAVYAVGSTATPDVVYGCDTSSC
jgi:hypothetical protein